MQSSNRLPERKPSPPVVDYARLTTESPHTPRAALRSTIIRIMGYSWPIVGMMAGISSDRVKIPYPRKVAITSSGLIVAVLLFISPGKSRWGCAAAFLGYALLTIAVMWFWN